MARSRLNKCVKSSKGGREVCTAAGIPVAGGHSIDTPEPIYGLAVNGLCAPSELRRNCDAKAGDVIILTKPVGVGVYSAAFKKDALSAADYADMIATMTRLNRVGAELAKNPAVHAMTDVTGFGVLGHGLEMARGSGLKLVLQAKPSAASKSSELAQEGFVTGASGRNWESYGQEVDAPIQLSAVAAASFLPIRKHLAAFSSPAPRAARTASFA